MSNRQRTLTCDFTAAGGSSIVIPALGKGGFNFSVSREEFATGAGITVERGAMYNPSGVVHDFSVMGALITEMVARREGIFTFEYGDSNPVVLRGRHVVTPQLTARFCEAFIGLASATGNPGAGSGWTSVGAVDGQPPVSVSVESRGDGKDRPRFKYFSTLWNSTLDETTYAAVVAAGFSEDNLTDDNQLALKLPNGDYLMLDNQAVSVMADPGESPGGVRGIRLRLAGASEVWADLVSFVGTAKKYFNGFELSVHGFAYRSDDTSVFSDARTGPV